MAEQRPESGADLVRCLEEVSGKRIRTREDVQRYLEEISAKRPESGAAVRLWQTLKQGTWLLLLAAAFLQYYLIDILLKIDSLPEIRVNVPVIVLKDKPPSRI